MDGLREPVGGQPPEVYWRRRIVAIVGAVLLLVVVYFLWSSPGGGDDGEAGVSPNPEDTNATTSPLPSDGATDGTDVSRACTASDVSLTATPNPGQFGAGALPVFDVSISHTGNAPCLLDTAAADTELLITSGSDRIFSSLDCPTDATINAREFLLQPGAKETFSVTWSRQRSAPECADVSATPGNGTYHALLTIQGIEAPDTTFQLTG
ncbi:hypothetical protein LGT39_10325 [Demequina sp. TTPB684]|uniref:hypothetical protein n=1 Tax=unclassified Demequina TaxID=2620311 RepID=UPI001CF4BFC8|nr:MULTISPECIES: hypothetical protein [unclassified Demequina]MCB2413237.1 hypothetical protein [Demequina sp. TTPB684]UPU88188.1 hypothetical protein LGT36_013225 [Demequina sp. TMPB413]